MRIRLDRIQGNITPGFRKDHQAFLCLRLPGAEASRRWLRELLPDIASATELATFNELFRLIRRRRPGLEADVVRATWVNIAFSWSGLSRLGASSIERFPSAFRMGLRGRTAETGDDPTTVATWGVGGTPDTEADALLLLAADTCDDLGAELTRQQERLERHGVGLLKPYEGHALPGELSGHEHFGFRDGISQPDLSGEWDVGDPSIALGEFILGYPNELGKATVDGPAWAREGSYIAFRKLRQDVFGFRQMVSREATRAAVAPELFAAKLVGRWRSGGKLDGARDPGWDPRAAAIERIDFTSDPAGERVPRFAHIRKANPRDVESAEPRRHRLLRRGIPYGPPLPSNASRDDRQDRGLLFLAYQADLARQFEHVQREWLNKADFPRPGTGSDPVAGHPSGRREVSLPQKGGSVSLSLEQFVSVTAGGYFFAPSIPALADLADATFSPGKEETIMIDERYGSELGAFIMEENPYGAEVHLPRDLSKSPDVEREGPARSYIAKRAIELGPEGITLDPKDCQWWYFGGRPRQVSKTIRIRYTYMASNGRSVTEHLLIGYEGSGGQ